MIQITYFYHRADNHCAWSGDLDDAIFFHLDAEYKYGIANAVSVATESGE